MTLPTLRRRTTVALQGAELPECFQLATIASAVNALDRDTKSAKASRRRLVEKAEKLAGVE